MCWVLINFLLILASFFISFSLCHYFISIVCHFFDFVYIGKCHNKSYEFNFNRQRKTRNGNNLLILISYIIIIVVYCSYVFGVRFCLSNSDWLKWKEDSFSMKTTQKNGINSIEFHSIADQWSQLLSIRLYTVYWMQNKIEKLQNIVFELIAATITTKVKRQNKIRGKKRNFILLLKVDNKFKVLWNEMRGNSFNSLPCACGCINVIDDL